MGKDENAKRARMETNQAAGSSSMGGDKIMALFDELIDGFDGADEDDYKVDLEYHNRLVVASKQFKSDDQFRELLRLRFKLIAKGVIKPKRSLDGLQIPQSVLENVRELFDCLDWAALSVDE